MSSFSLDYLSTTVELVFMSGAFNGSMECANISIVNDSRLEENETFDIELTSSDPDVVLGNNVTTIILVDDDGK